MGTAIDSAASLFAAQTPQDRLVDALLSVRGAAAQRALVGNHAGEWTTDAVALLKGHCDRQMGTAPRRALHTAHLCRLVAASLADPGSLALADRALAQACHVLGHYGMAVPLYERSAEAFERAGSVEQAGGSRSALVDALMHLGRYDDALALAAHTREMLVALGAERRVALLDANIGNGYLLLDRPLDALEAYTRAGAAFATLEDPVSLGKVAIGRGNALAALNRPQSAIDALETAAAQFEALGLDAYAGQARYNLAYVQFLMGRYAEALAGLERARGIFQELDDRRHLALCTLDEAEILLILGRADESADLAAQSAASLLRLGLRKEAATAQALAAQALIALGQPDGARAAIDGARATFVAAGNTPRLARAEVTAAALLLQRGDPLAALRLCAAAVAGLAGEHHAAAAEAHLLRARLLRQLRLPGSRAASLRALALARGAGAPWLAWQASYLLGQLSAERGNLAAAAGHFRRALLDVERVRRSIPSAELRASFQGDKQRLYEDVVQNALARGAFDEAFSLVERAKSRALVETLGGTPRVPPAAGGGDLTLLERSATLRAELTWLYNRLHSGDDSLGRLSVDPRTIMVEVRARERELDRVLRRLNTHQAEYVSLRSVTTVTSAAVRAILPPDTALLEYVVVSDDAFVFVLRATGMAVVRLPGAMPLVGQLLQRWRLHLGKFAYGPAYLERQAAALQATARQILCALFDILLRPLLAPGDTANLVIVPHGALHAVPFHALHTGSGYVIEERDVSYAPSAGIYRFCRRRAASSGGSMLIVGVPDERTPAIPDEVAVVADLFDDGVVLAGAAATGAAFARSASGAARIHIASHAIFRADNPAFSALRLADSWLTLPEIYGLQLRADLVVLSGCETGAVGTGGEEVIGLVRGFLYAGTPTVIASMWAVDDAAAAACMTAFYRALRAGTAPGAALCLAQRAQLRGGLHPYFWAPFTVIGRS